MVRLKGLVGPRLRRAGQLAAAIGVPLLAALTTACIARRHRLAWREALAYAGVHGILLVAAAEAGFAAWWHLVLRTRLEAMPSPHGPRNPQPMRDFQNMLSLARMIPVPASESLLHVASETDFPDGPEKKVLQMVKARAPKVLSRLPLAVHARAPAPLVDIKRFLSDWFHGTDFSNIRQGNVAELLAYGFYYRSLKEMEACGLGHIPMQMVEELQRAGSISIPPGYNPDLKAMFHLWEPLRCSYRPLTFYLVMELVACFTRAALTRVLGFKLLASDAPSSVSMLIRQPDKSTALRPQTQPQGTQQQTRDSIPEQDGQEQQPCEQQQRQQRQPPQPDALQQQQKQQKQKPAAWRPQHPQQQQRQQQQSAAIQFLHQQQQQQHPQQQHPQQQQQQQQQSAAIQFLHQQQQQHPQQHPQQQSAAIQHLHHHQQLHPGDPPLTPHHAEPVVSLPPSPLLLDLGPGASGSILSDTSPPSSPNESPHPSPRSTAPILFLHGVGLGNLPYLPFIERLLDSGRTIICMEARHVTMCLCAHIPTPDEVATDVIRALDELGIQKVDCVSHSYGTFVASCIAQHHPGRLHSLTLIDPVCLAPFLPNLVSGFVYKVNRSSRSSSSPTPLAGLEMPLMMHQWPSASVMMMRWMIGLVSSEVHMAATFGRRFYWSDVNLWADDMPPQTLIVLSGQDDLLHAEEIRVIIGAISKAKILYHDHHPHAGFLTDAESQDNIVQEILQAAAARDSSDSSTAQPVNKTETYITSPTTPHSCILSTSSTASSSCWS